MLWRFVMLIKNYYSVVFVCKECLWEGEKKDERRVVDRLNVALLGEKHVTPLSGQEWMDKCRT